MARDYKSERVSACALVARTYLQIDEPESAQALLDEGLRYVRTMSDVKELVKAGQPDFVLTGDDSRFGDDVYITEAGNGAFNVTFDDGRMQLSVPCRPEDLHALVTFVHREEDE